MEDTMILIASPVRQKPSILREFLCSLRELDCSGLEIEYCFVDDNDDLQSSNLLSDFRQECGRPYLHIGATPEAPYVCDHLTHHWDTGLISRVADHKNTILRMARPKGCSVFFVDSDLILHPETLQMLVSRDKDIVSEVFWTAWNIGQPGLPNVWIAGQYRLSLEFLEQLRVPGCYEVGGLGACTLVSEKAVKAGCCFSPIPNVDYWGEDRHFCIRASVLGFGLWADTTLPALHLYRESDL
jgi:hypothetical protein